MRRGRLLRWLLLPVALGISLSAFAGRPYEDTKKRFRINLAEHWELAPRFGDMNGMTFQRVVKSRRGDALGILWIQIDSSGAAGPKEYADQVEKDLEKQPGFLRLEAKKSTIGGRPTLVREYKMLASRKPRIEKRARAHYFEAIGHLYLLHFEASANEFERLLPEIEQMIETFTPLETAVAPGAAEEAHDGASSKSEIVGRWKNDDGLVLVLGDDGTFALAEASGRYEVRGPTLTLIIPGQGRESFTFIHDAGARTLTLSSANLGQPMTYRRTSGAAGAKPKRGGAVASEARGGELLGRWSTPTPGGALHLALLEDKRFKMGQMSGRWSASADQLTLSRAGEAPIVYRFRFEDGRLLLSGGDLEEEVAFSRQGGP